MAEARSGRSTPRHARVANRAQVEAIAWVGSALRTERVLRALEARRRADLPR